MNSTSPTEIWSHSQTHNKTVWTKLIVSVKGSLPRIKLRIILIEAQISANRCSPSSYKDSDLHSTKRYSRWSLYKLQKMDLASRKILTVLQKLWFQKTSRSLFKNLLLVTIKRIKTILFRRLIGFKGKVSITMMVNLRVTLAKSHCQTTPANSTTDSCQRMKTIWRQEI